MSGFTGLLAMGCCLSSSSVTERFGYHREEAVEVLPDVVIEGSGESLAGRTGTIVGFNDDTVVVSLDADVVTMMPRQIAMPPKCIKKRVV